jgi:hypothetical protein
MMRLLWHHQRFHEKATSYFHGENRLLPVDGKTESEKHTLQSWSDFQVKHIDFSKKTYPSGI